MSAWPSTPKSPTRNSPPFCSDYELGEVLSFKGIAEGVENSNYLLQTTTGTYILTLYEKRVAPEDLPFFLGLMEHLAARASPARRRSCTAATARPCGALCGRPAAVISFLEGSGRAASSPTTAELGAALAEIASRRADFAMARPNDLSVSGWRPLFEASCRTRPRGPPRAGRGAGRRARLARRSLADRTCPPG